MLDVTIIWGRELLLVKKRKVWNQEKK